MSKYVKAGKEVGELITEKQVAYGNSFGKSQEILKVLWPDGVPVEQYRDLLTVTRIIDKLFRIASQKFAFEESPYKDIAGYALLGMVADEDSAQENVARVDYLMDQLTVGTVEEAREAFEELKQLHASKQNSTNPSLSYTMELDEPDY